MSTSTEVMSAQVSSGLRSLPGSVGSSTTEAVSLHPSLRETLVTFNLPASTTIRQLYALLSELDHECLRHATGLALDPAHDSTSDVESVVELAIFLSGSLSQCGYPGTSMFQEIQLRALISSLALLQHHEVDSLDPDLYDKLRLKNISARFQKIAFQLHRNSTLADRIRHAPNVYLIQLASQYVSLINRGDSPWPSIVEPTVEIIVSALSLGGGQYNRIREIISGLNQLINIWQRPRTKYQALCGLQEHTRLATSLCRESVVADESGELRIAATAVVTALVDKVNEILAADNGTFPPELARRWHKSIAIFSRGPPDLDQGYYFYGLLDCISQLSAVSDPQLLGKQLLNRVKDLIFDSVVPEFRWKAIEIVLSCHCTRQEQYQMLRRDLETRVAVETKANICEEMRFIQMQLENDEEESLRFRVLRPLRRLPMQSAAPNNGSSSGSATPTIPSNPGNSPVDEVDVSPTLRPESALTRSRIKSSTTFSLQSVRKFSKSYDSAGLFEDCRHAFFNNDNEISVYKLGDLQRKPALPSFSKIFAQEYKREIIRYVVASSQSCIIIVTNKRLLNFDIEADKLMDTATHGAWDPSGLACHESETHLVVFLGQCQRHESKKYNGHIRVYRYRKGGQTQKLPVFDLKMPANDYPKRFSFDRESQILACITRIQNKLLVWKFHDEFLSLMEPFEFQENKCTAETDETGVTSATVYQSPSKRGYVLCTTAPSTERYRHGGEWSFVQPIPSDVSQSHMYPGGQIHTFEQFKDHRPLFVGRASTQHHIFAVLEKSGKLYFLRLDKHPDGGIHSPDENAEILVHSLCKQDRPLTECLRFDPSGSCLFAVDPRGKIIVTDFENE